VSRRKLDSDPSQDIAVADTAEIADLTSATVRKQRRQFPTGPKDHAEVASAGVAAADFDLDGRIDLAVPMSRAVSVWQFCGMIQGALNVRCHLRVHQRPSI